MKIRALLFTAAALAATLGPLGCGGGTPPAKAPAKEAAPAAADPPPPAPAPAARPALLGLPLTGSQIDVIGDIEFDTNAATIRTTPASQGVLTTLAGAGKAYPQITKLRVEGHTDSDGNEASNQLLSERRAQAVVKWLVDHGIDPKRLNAVGCGSRDPIFPNTTAENKQKNRRTEFDIDEVEGQPFADATAACAPNPARKH